MVAPAQEYVDGRDVRAPRPQLRGERGRRRAVARECDEHARCGALADVLHAPFSSSGGSHLWLDR
eukprot:6063411-Pleurochrysis_carterae.AAC.1